MQAALRMQVVAVMHFSRVSPRNETVRGAGLCPSRQPATARISGAQRSSIGRIASALAAGRLITTRAMPRSRYRCSRSRSSVTRNNVTGSEAGSRPASVASLWNCGSV